MKRTAKVVTIASCIASLFTITPAHGATPNSWYVGASGDLTWLEHSDLGGGVNLALGHRFWPNDAGAFRIEAEGGYHRAKGENTNPDTRYFTYMGNVYYDFYNLFSKPGSGLHISPYIGGGLGGVAIRYGNSSFAGAFRNNESAFAYQGMVGLNLTPANSNTEWSLGYRYLGNSGNNLHANNLGLGLRLHF